MKLHRLPPPHDDREAQRDQLVSEYLRALDARDDQTIDRVLDAAIDDPILDARLAEADRALLEADGLPSAQAAAEVDAVVRAALSPTPVPTDAPLTIGRIAASLKAADRVPPDSHAYNESLLSDESPVPDTFRAADFDEALSNAAPQPSTDYVRAFVSEAGRLAMSSLPDTALLAARSTRRASP